MSWDREELRIGVLEEFAAATRYSIGGVLAGEEARVARHGSMPSGSLSLDVSVYRYRSFAKLEAVPVRRSAFRAEAARLEAARQARLQWERGQRQRRLCTCRACGRAVPHSPGERNYRRFCDGGCAYAWHLAHNHTRTTNCLWCGALLQVGGRAGRPRRYCSDLCWYKYTGAQKKQAPRDTLSQQTRTCCRCQQPFTPKNGRQLACEPCIPEARRARRATHRAQRKTCGEDPCHPRESQLTADENNGVMPTGGDHGHHAIG